MKIKLIIISLLLLTSMSYSNIIIVPTEQPTIQAGIDAATEHDTVLVADGTYTGDGNGDVDFNGKNLVLMSENGPEFTIISPPGGVKVQNGEDETTVIEGFTIKYGSVSALKVSNNSSPKVINCIFTYNHRAVYCSDSSPDFINCIFSFNSIYEPPDSPNAARGGAMYIVNSSPTLTGCFFYGNFVGYGFIGEWDYSFSDENAIAEGGAVYIGDCSAQSSLPIFDGCTFYNNSAQAGAGWWVQEPFALFPDYWYLGAVVAEGGAIYTETPITINNCNFVLNSVFATNQALGLTNYLYFSESAIYGCNNGNVNISCSNLFNNLRGDTEWNWTGCISDQAGINGNFSADPLFCDTDNRDFHLRGNSPCAPDNNSCGELVGALDVGCIEFSCTDVNNDNLTNIADIQFFQSYYFECDIAPEPFWLGDLNCDEEVNLLDLTILSNYVFDNNITLCCNK
ncbi:hypothetical protein ACFLQG_01580 [Candidatus Zixiibacteriota bacterium]